MATQSYEFESSYDSWGFSSSGAVPYELETAYSYPFGGGIRWVANIVYDTVAGAYVAWATQWLPDPDGAKYPGPGVPPTDWDTDSYAFYLVYLE